MSGSISVFEIDGKPDNFDSLVSCLIEISGCVFFVTPESTESVRNLEQIRANSSKWPDWRSRPWIVAGMRNGSSGDKEYSGPFMTDCNGGAFNRQVDSLLDCFDWALFSYFTTFHSGLGCLVSSCPDVVCVPVEKAYGDSAEISFYSDNPVASLRTATFYDYQTEGFFAYELAKMQQEVPPLLFCRIELSDPGRYEQWNSELEEYEEGNWYRPYLERLNIVRDFTSERYGVKFRNIICEATDESAYLALWSQASEDHSIAEATFSANTDLDELESYIRGSYVFEVTRELDSFTEWAYSQVYGGGADEHHAIFRSRDPEITSRLWGWLGEGQISRF